AVCGIVVLLAIAHARTPLGTLHDSKHAPQRTGDILGRQEDQGIYRLPDFVLVSKNLLHFLSTIRYSVYRARNLMIGHLDSEKTRCTSLRHPTSCSVCSVPKRCRGMT